MALGFVRLVSLSWIVRRGSSIRWFRRPINTVTGARSEAAWDQTDSVVSIYLSIPFVLCRYSVSRRNHRRPLHPCWDVYNEGSPTTHLSSLDSPSCVVSQLALAMDGVAESELQLGTVVKVFQLYLECMMHQTTASQHRTFRYILIRSLQFTVDSSICLFHLVLFCQTSFFSAVSPLLSRSRRVKHVRYYCHSNSYCRYCSQSIITPFCGA